MAASRVRAMCSVDCTVFFGSCRVSLISADQGLESPHPTCPASSHEREVVRIMIHIPGRRRKVGDVVPGQLVAQAVWTWVVVPRFGCLRTIRGAAAGGPDRVKRVVATPILDFFGLEHRV